MSSHSTQSRSSKHVPVVIGNCAPFRLVQREKDKWNPTLDEINDRKYDYVKLCRVSMFLDVGISPYSLAITFDGSFILPAIPKFRDRDSALKKYNKVLGILLLGGIYSEAVQPVDISQGSMTLEGYVKNYGGGTGSIAHLHRAMQTKTIGAIDVIELLEPKFLLKDKIEIAFTKGKSYFSLIPNLSPELLLNGVSNYVKNQWVEALIFIWTTIEQLINIIWETKIITKKDKKKEEVIEGRKAFLEDFRTWTTATKIEVLFQNHLLDAHVYRLLNVARKSRNDFIHSGRELNEKKVRDALEALFRILSLVISDFNNSNELEQTLQEIYKNQRGGIFQQEKELGENAITYWMELPPLPGDTNWKGEYEVIKEFVLKPIK